MNNEQIEKNWGNVWELEKIEEATQSDPAHKLFSNILSKYPKGAKVLDAGSGLGKWVFSFQKKGYQAYGVDIVAEVVKRCQKHARENNLACQFSIGDVRNLAFSDNFFDVIISYGTIEHFVETEDAVKEFYRVLGKDGTCLITTPNVYCARTFITRPILNILKNPKLGYQGYEKSFTPKQLSQIMKKVGFKNLDYGIIPDGVFLGDFYRFIPVIGKYFLPIARKISFWIEKRQSKLGHTAYCLGIK